MSLIVRMRRQFAVWWQRDPTPDQFGKFSFAAPVEIRCRWDDVAKEFLDKNGETQTSMAIAYVDRILAPGDRLKRGEMESDTPLDPIDVEGAFEIRRFDQNPNLRASETLLTAFM